MSDRELLDKVKTMNEQRAKQLVRLKKALTCSVILLVAAFVLSVYVVSSQPGVTFAQVKAMYTQRPSVILVVAAVLLFVFTLFVDILTWDIKEYRHEFSSELTKAEFEARKRDLIR